jgi:hypothetical protein
MKMDKAVNARAKPDNWQSVYPPWLVYYFGNSELESLDYE